MNLQAYPWHTFRKDMDAEIARLPGQDWQRLVDITDPTMGEWVAEASKQLTKLGFDAPTVWAVFFGKAPTKGQIVGLNRAIINGLSQFTGNQVPGAIAGLVADREPEETGLSFEGTELVGEETDDDNQS